MFKTLDEPRRLQTGRRQRQTAAQAGVIVVSLVDESGTATPARHPPDPPKSRFAKQSQFAGGAPGPAIRSASAARLESHHRAIRLGVGSIGH